MATVNINRNKNKTLTVFLKKVYLSNVIKCSVAQYINARIIIAILNHINPFKKDSINSMITK